MSQEITAIPQGTLVQWCLISHTNIGKTTLTRTLLGQDVGDIRDAPHVTDTADAHTLVQTREGDRLILWDTPGFGDSVRLHQRLEQQSNPMGWLMSNIWDRWRDKPFWMSQRAMRAARESADVVLYLVNAAENPADAGYLDAEMHLLRWLRRPVIVLLNQTGAPQTVRQQDEDLRTWMRALSRYRPMVREILALDAFTRSWIQEQRLFHAVRASIPAEKQPAYQRIVTTWEAGNEKRFDASMAEIARLLSQAAQWKEPVPKSASGHSPLPNLDTLKNILPSGLTHILTGSDGKTGKAPPGPEQQAMQNLLRHLQKHDQRSTETLLALHRLDGRAGAQIHEQLHEYFTVHQPLDMRQMGLLGALASGAAGGLGADLASGGLTMGAGAVLGALAGAVTFAGAAFGLNRIREHTEHEVELSDEFLDSLLHAAMLKYFAVAHFGRGRGAFTEADSNTPAPAHWHEALKQQSQPHQTRIREIWQALRATPESDESASQPLFEELHQLTTQIVRAALLQLYPEPAHQRAKAAHAAAASGAARKRANANQTSPEAPQNAASSTRQTQSRQRPRPAQPSNNTNQ